MQVWFWYKIRRLIMRFKQQLQLLSLLAVFFFGQACASQPVEKGEFSPSEKSLALDTSVSASQEKRSSDEDLLGFQPTTEASALVASTCMLA